MTYDRAHRARSAELPPRQPLQAAGVALLVLAVVAAPTAQEGSVTSDPRLQQAIAWYTGTAGRVDDDRAHALLVEAAAAGDDPIVRMWLARCYSRGRMRFERDEAKARALAREVIERVERLAHEDVTEAVFLVGTAYDEALGKPEDPARAVSWFHRAADRGHVLAQHNLGNAYVDGRGVPQSDSIAVYWWRRAALAGDAIPQLRLAEMYETGRGVPRNLAEARRWYRSSADRGNAQAARALQRLDGR